jgi:hypothetical protein
MTINETVHYLARDPNLTNALATVASAVVALCALLISIISLFITLWSLWNQRRHNFLSVRPLPFISRADYENRIAVKIHNNGIGPLIILKLVVTDGTSSKKSIVEWMPPLPSGLAWDTFVQELENRSLAPEHEIVLLQLIGDPNEEDFRAFRKECREALKKLTVTLHFSDAYNRLMKPAQQTLSWFGRHEAGREK